MNFLGIDLGTPEVKVLLLRDDHTVLTQTHAPLEISQPRSWWSEQHPDL